MNKIIVPGDPEFDPKFVPPAEAPKLPDEVLEAAFTEVVKEVQAAIVQGEDPGDAVPPPSPSPEEPFQNRSWYRKGAMPGFKMHRPAQNKSFDLPMQHVQEAELTEDLPRSWEKKCHISLRKGDKVTLISMTYYPGAGILYGFQEGSRGGYGLRQDQINFLGMVPEESVDTPHTETSPVPSSELDKSASPSTDEIKE